ncbi:hypothetical protein NliqN6_6011 [Naganishia liquefaciens]|uniref:Uncharacterized protein n=1 Tax=Naganishia liquefaciens TaxID=104408 RepID=A0A8H3TYU5_9TREE|nr:hypothetical protein NliqN6_6011 [Naganishia liquefaciens]
MRGSRVGRADGFNGDSPLAPQFADRLARKRKSLAIASVAPARRISARREAVCASQGREGQHESFPTFSTFHKGGLVIIQIGKKGHDTTQVHRVIRSRVAAGKEKDLRATSSPNTLLTSRNHFVHSSSDLGIPLGPLLAAPLVKPLLGSKPWSRRSISIRTAHSRRPIRWEPRPVMWSHPFRSLPEYSCVTSLGLDEPSNAREPFGPLGCRVGTLQYRSTNLTQHDAMTRSHRQQAPAIKRQRFVPTGLATGTIPCIWHSTPNQSASNESMHKLYLHAASTVGYCGALQILWNVMMGFGNTARHSRLTRESLGDEGEAREQIIPQGSYMAPNRQFSFDGGSNPARYEVSRAW